MPRQPITTNMKMASPHTDDNSKRGVSSSSLTTTLRGVLFRCTIRGGHATLAIIPSSRVDNEEDNRIVMVVVQMGGGQWNNNESAAGSNVTSSSSSTSSSDQFARSIVEMRSNIRRMCKLGNELEFIGTHHTNPSNNSVDETTSSNTDNTKDWTTWRKFTVNYNLQLFQANIKVATVAKWDAATCQRVRSKFFDDSSKQKQQHKQQPAKMKRREDTIGGNGENYTQHSSTKGKQKRIQGEVLADFVLWMLSTIHDDENDNVDQVTEKTRSNNELTSTEIGLQKFPTDQNYLFIDRWRPLHPSLASSSSSVSVTQSKNKLMTERLGNNITNRSNIHINQDEKANPQSFALGGILDAAGGAGHVSLAFSLRGIQSTVVDPRPTIGKLPGRDRKVLKKSKCKEQFSTYRAWFGSKPEGVDTIYREGRTSLETFLPESERSDHNPLGVDDDGQQLPICSMNSNDILLPNCAAIVALHPDEATGVIVQTAVQNKIPFGEICTFIVERFVHPFDRIHRLSS